MREIAKQLDTSTKTILKVKKNINSIILTNPNNDNNHHQSLEYGN